MSGLVREEIWVCKGTSRMKKYFSLILLVTFWMVWKEKNKGAFKGVEDVFDMVLGLEFFFLNYGSSSLFIGGS